jgi:hypothetical protein
MDDTAALLDVLLAPRRAPFADLAAFRAAWRPAAAAWAAPIDRALVGGAMADRLGYVFTQTGVNSTLRSFHGTEELPNLGEQLIGPRQLDRRDGQFLQPDPLLFNPLQGSILEDPARLNPYRYGRNTPNTYGDTTGNAVDIIVDAVSIGYDLYTIWQAPAVATNWLALGGDVLGAAVPGLTGVGAGVRVAAHADEAVQVGANVIGHYADDVASAGGSKAAGALDEATSTAATGSQASEGAALRKYGGPGGGHHVPAKSAFRDAPGYDLNEALAISNAELARLGVSHPAVTAGQMQGYRAFSPKCARSGVNAS